MADIGMKWFVCRRLHAKATLKVEWKLSVNSPRERRTTWSGMVTKKWKGRRYIPYREAQYIPKHRLKVHLHVVARKAGNAAGAKGPYCSCSSSSMGGRGALRKAPITLQYQATEDLRPGEGRVDWRRWSRPGLLGSQPKALPVERSHNPGCEASRKAPCWKSARRV